MPLTGDKLNAVSKLGRDRSFPVAANVTIYTGAIVALDTSGYARPARVSTTDRVVGIAKRKVVNGAVAGAVRVEVEADKLYLAKNSASTDAIALTHIGQDAYIVDDETVALTSGGGTRCRAGKIHDVDASGVYISLDDEARKLLAVSCRLADVSTASSAYVASPVAGTVVKIVSALEAAITVADSAITTAIQPPAGGGFVDITGGNFTVAFTGAAIGDTDSATPTAANAVAEGSTLRVTTDGGSTTTAPLTVTFLISAA